MALLPNRYVIRAIKSVLYTLCIFVLMFGGIYLLADKRNPDLTFIDFVAVNNWKYMIAFICTFSLAFPLVTFSKRELVLEKGTEKLNSFIKEIFETSGYIVENESAKCITFRAKNKITRVMRMFGEDAVRVYFVEDNVIMLEGRRSDVYRLASHIEYLSKEI